MRKRQQWVLICPQSSEPDCDPVQLLHDCQRPCACVMAQKEIGHLCSSLPRRVPSLHRKRSASAEVAAASLAAPLSPFAAAAQWCANIAVAIRMCISDHSVSLDAQEIFLSL